MSKILVFNLPLHGHVNPSLAVVEELVARDETVIYYMTDEFKSKIEATGAIFRHLEMPSDTLSEEFMGDRFFGMVDRGFQLIPQLVDEFCADPPDYVIYDAFCMWAKHLATILGVPAIALYPTYASNSQFNAMKVFASYNSSKMTPALGIKFDMDWMFKLRSHIEQLCKIYNLPYTDSLDFMSPSELLNIVFIPQAFHPVGNTFDERFVFVGSSIGQPRETKDNFPIERLKDQPTLYISLGTIFNQRLDFFQTCLEAFEGQPWQVVLSIGKAVDRSALGTIPDNFIVAASVPQLAVLEHTDIFLTHGGMNSVMEALYYGVPLVVMPQMAEQQLTAEQVVQLELGVAIANDGITADRLRATVESTMSNPLFRSRAGWMQKEIRGSGGYRQAVDAMMQYKEHLKTSIC